MILQLLPVIFLKLCYFFNPKLFDTPYLQNKSQTHILAVKVLNSVISSFFCLSPIIVLNVYYLSTCVSLLLLFFSPLEFLPKHLLITCYVQVLY